MGKTRSEMRRKFIAAVNRRYKKDHKFVDANEGAEQVAPWDDQASWEIKALMAEIFDEAFPKVKA